MKPLVVVKSIADVPCPASPHVAIGEWMRFRNDIKELLAKKFQLYTGPQDVHDFDVHVIDDRMNDCEVCVTIDMEGEAYSSYTIEMLGEAVDTRAGQFYISLVPYQDSVSEPLFYIAIFADRIYCLPNQSDCIEEFGLRSL